MEGKIIVLPSALVAHRRFKVGGMCPPVSPYLYIIHQWSNVTCNKQDIGVEISIPYSVSQARLKSGNSDFSGNGNSKANINHPLKNLVVRRYFLSL